MAEPAALAHMVLAQLLTMLAELHDAGTPHRKEPAGYAEAGPSGPLWGPVRLTCATCPQVALSKKLGEGWGKGSRVCKVAQASLSAKPCPDPRAVDTKRRHGRL